MSIQLNDEQRKLVAYNHNLIYQYLIDNHLPQDEYYDIAAIGLCKAALKYDTYKGAFSTYVYRAIQNNISRDKVTEKRHTVSAMSYNVTASVHGEETDVEYIETFLSNTDVENENVTKTFFKWFIEYMSLRELQIMYCKSKNMTDREIGKKYNVTHAAISSVWRRIKKAYQNNDRVYTVKRVYDIKDEEEIKNLKSKLLDIVELVV